MKHAYAFATRPIVAAGMALLALLAAPAQAVNYTLVAAPIAASPMPDAASVAMWGYRVCAGTVAPAACAAPAVPTTSPGAALVVPPGDNVLSVTLHNELGVPTSFVVHGLNTAMAPVFTDSPTLPGTASNCTPGAGADDATRRACRLRSFTTEAAPGGGSATYTYNNVRPGTYLYQSGTLPQVQVQMGLYGMMSKDAAALTVYPGVTYTNQSRVIFSEVDPAMHAAVAAGTFTGSTLDYDPKHFRTHVYNEATHLPEQVNAGASAIYRPGAPHLIRMANAGLQTRVPTLNNGTWALLGEDAQPYPYTREQYTAFLPAAKTTEAWIGDVRAVTLFDRRMAFADAAGGAVAGQFLRFSPVTPAQLTHNCVTNATQGVLYTCTASSSTAGATVSVAGPTGMAFAAGTVTWTPTNAQAQKPATPTLAHPVTITASAPGSETTSSSFSVTVANVNDAPTALADSYTAALGSLSLTVPVATGVLGNDTDPDGDTLTALVTVPVVGTGTLTLSADGSFTFTLPAGTLLPQTRSFTYTANDGTVASNAVTVTMTFPVALQANADTFAFINTTARTAQTISVLANDTSGTAPLFQLGSIQVSRTDLGAGAGVDFLTATATLGGVTTPAAGTILYTAPLNVNANVSFTGTDTFYYRVNNNNGTPSNWAQVTVTINAGPAPATVADVFAFFNTAARPVQTINVLGNDTSTTGFNLGNVEVARESTGAGGTSTGTLTATTARGQVSTPGATGAITYQAPTNGAFGVAGYTGADYFYYRVMNQSGVFSPWTRVDVTIAAMAVADAYTLLNTTARPTIVLNVLGNDTSNTVPPFQLNSIQISETGTDAGVDSLPADANFGAIATPNNGTGTITYQAALNVSATVSFVGSETFYYRVSNNAGVQSNWAPVTVTIVAGPPVAAVNTFTFNNTAARPTQTFNVLGNDSASVAFNLAAGVEIKRDAADLTGTSTGALTATTLRGQVSTPNVTGTITYQAPLNGVTVDGFVGTDTFYYRVQDVNGNWSAWTLVTVNMT